MDRENFDSKIDSLLKNAEQKIPNEDLPTLLPIEYLPNISKWHTFEHELWNIREIIRQTIHDEQKNLNVEQADRVRQICLNPNAKRGRQSFVMLLSRKRYFAYADRLINLLQDVDVSGHVLDSLYKMRALQYHEEVKPLLNSEYTWISNLAKRYMKNPASLT
ncbi:MAG: hypothetical protein SPH94_00405 [Fusobacterium necrophorum]|nr:hypothetical protein [Fusobacterium necrophorum]